MKDINIEQLKRDIEADENIVSFGLFYDRKEKKMVFVKSGSEDIIDKMVNKAAYSVQGFIATTSKIAWRWAPKNSGQSSNPFGYDPFNPLGSIFGI